MKMKDLLVPLTTPAPWSFETTTDPKPRRVVVTAQSWFAARREAAQRLGVDPPTLKLVGSPLEGKSS